VPERAEKKTKVLRVAKGKAIGTIQETDRVEKDEFGIMMGGNRKEAEKAKKKRQRLKTG